MDEQAALEAKNRAQGCILTAISLISGLVVVLVGLGLFVNAVDSSVTMSLENVILNLACLAMLIPLAYVTYKFGRRLREGDGPAQREDE